MNKKFIALKPANNKVFYGNKVFNETLSTSSPYWIEAKKLLANKNIVMNTIDIPSEEPTVKDVYVDVPYPWELHLWLRIILHEKKNILFMIEPPVVNPFSYMKIFRIFFSKIYTWNDDLVDNKKYFKFTIPKTTFGMNTKAESFDNKKLLALMNGNWLPFLPFQLLSLTHKELYSERIKAIDFFDTYHSRDFCLYGRGWNKPQRFSLKQHVFGYKKYKSYKGEFGWKDKYKILSKFKFALCFENSQITGYISEKIFDCFKAKCVPVYLGAPNIRSFIPESCYIDKNRFASYESLYMYLKNMKKDEYNTYIKNAQKLLRDKRIQDQWFPEGFARFFLRMMQT